MLLLPRAAGRPSATVFGCRLLVRTKAMLECVVRRRRRWRDEICARYSRRIPSLGLVVKRRLDAADDPIREKLLTDAQQDLRL